MSNPRAKVTANLLLRFRGRINRIIELSIGNASILIKVAKMMGLLNYMVWISMIKLLKSHVEKR